MVLYFDSIIIQFFIGFVRYPISLNIVKEYQGFTEGFLTAEYILKYHERRISSLFLQPNLYYQPTVFWPKETL